MDNELRDLEDQLGRLSPMAMPDDMLARMEKAMDRWKEFTPAEEKIVPFSGHGAANQKSGKFHIWASAAAVALIGAVTTVLVIPEKGSVIGSGPVADTSSVSESSVDAPLSSLSQPANIVGVNNSKFNTKITDEPSYSITYDAEGKPHRLVKVRFEDEITLYDDKGRPVKVKKPRIEYYLVPVQIR